MLKITSPQNVRIKKAVQLHSSRGRKQQKRSIVFGWREVSRCLDSELEVEELFVRDFESFHDSERLLALAAKKQAEVVDVSEPVFESLSYGARDDAVVAIAKRPSLQLDQIDLPANGFCLVLESIEKPGNIGAIFRSADGAGVDAIIIANPLTDPFHPNSIRSSMGTVFTMPTAISDAATVKSWLNGLGFQILSARPDSARNYYDVDFRGPTAVILGNEANGLSDEWAGEGIDSFKLPMLGIADSLNVSVTASILVYENLRQRSQDD